MSELARRLIAKEKKEKTGRLDVGKCGLRQLPKELFELEWLEILILGNWYWDKKAKKWKESQNPGATNQIQNIEDLSVFQNLSELNLSSNQISDIRFLEKLTNLQTLDLSSNQVSDIRFLEKLTNLQTLYLSSNQISDIRFLEKLTNLQTLYLSSNQISDYSFLEKLTNLQTLDLRYNQISDIRFLEKLTNLQTLDLRYNKIKDITFLTNLAKKALSKRLDISNNQIQDLTPILPLIKRGQPVKWDYWEDGICVQNNPLTVPTPEVIRQGNKAILQYFKDLEEQGKAYLYEAKLLIVGEGESGKTTLAWKLKDLYAPMPNKENDRTKGIDIQALEIRNQQQEDKPFRMNVWDFGGQEIYHATHQFFLTKRSLYVIVNNTRSNLTDFNHWVQTINLFSDNSPILIVQNEVAGSSTDFDLRGLQKQFSNVLYVRDSDLSNIEDGRLQRLIRDIHHQIQQLDHVGMELPAKWVAVRSDLETRAKTEAYITDRDFVRICQNNDITKKDAIRRLSALFHDLGLFLNFQDDPILKRLVILQNSWATKGVYAILDNKKIQGQKGHFSYDDAQAIWEGTEFEEMHDELLQLMAKFELCYRLSYQSDQYVSPQLLPLEQPEYDWAEEQNLTIYYEYDFMPKGLLARLIVRLHRYIKEVNQFAWRTGCVFVYENTEAQVIETYGKKRIEIRLNGAHCVRLSSIIIREIDELNDGFNQIKVDKLVPCVCRSCSVTTQPHFYKYDALMYRKARGKRKVECDLSFEDVLVTTVLNGVYQERKSKQPTIRELLEWGKIAAALELFGEKDPDNALLLHQQFKELEEEAAVGLISKENKRIERTNIINGLLTLSKKYGL